MKNQYHTPEGVRDIYSVECKRKLFLQSRIHNVIKTFGYEDIQTPTFEFFDVFNKEKGSVYPKNMYKFFDREGYTLVLRPDITPSIARAVSKYYSDFTMPVRLSYTGNTFINNSEYQGKLKEITQIGAELIGDGSPDADAEIIVMTIKSILACGIGEFQLEIGHVDFSDGLLEEADMGEEARDEYKHLLSNKNYFGVEVFINDLEPEAGLKEILVRLPELCGSFDVVLRAKSYINNEKSAKALERLEKVYDIISMYGYEKYVTFDLGMVSNYGYYTGIIFAAYTYGTGDSIATGGRYDRLLEQFGKQSPSTGFGINLDRMLDVVNRQNIRFDFPEKKVIIVYDDAHRQEAVKEAEKRRSGGEEAALIRICQEESANDIMNDTMVDSAGNFPEGIPGKNLGEIRDKYRKSADDSGILLINMV